MQIPLLGAAVTALTGAITINDAETYALDAVTSQSGSLVVPDATTVHLNDLRLTKLLLLLLQLLSVQILW